MQGYPLRMEDEVRELHKLAAVQAATDKHMEASQKEQAKAAMKSRFFS